MRLILLPVLAFTIAAGCDDPGATPDRVKVPSMTERYVLPSEMCGDYFVVQATINGAGPYPLLMDSGAGSTLLDPRVIEETGVRKMVDSLAIGEFKAFEFGIREHDMELLSAALGQRIDGILGHPVFNPLLLTYDFPARELTIEVGKLDAADAVRLRSGMNRPYVRANVDSLAFWVLIDTGSSRGLVLDELGRFPLAVPPTLTGGRVRVNGLLRVETARLASDALLGGQVLSEPFVARSASIHLVGQQILHRFAITFDHPSGLVRFSSPDSTDGTIPAAPVRISDIVIDPLTGRIQHVLDDASGFEVGDVVLSINEVPFDERTCPTPNPRPLSEDSRAFQLVRGADTLVVESKARYLMP